MVSIKIKPDLNELRGGDDAREGPENATPRCPAEAGRAAGSGSRGTDRPGRESDSPISNSRNLGSLLRKEVGVIGPREEFSATPTITETVMPLLNRRPPPGFTWELLLDSTPPAGGSEVSTRTSIFHHHVIGRRRQPARDRLHKTITLLGAAVALTRADWENHSVKESWLVPLLFRGSPSRW